MLHPPPSPPVLGPTNSKDVSLTSPLLPSSSNILPFPRLSAATHPGIAASVHSWRPSEPSLCCSACLGGSGPSWQVLLTESTAPQSTMAPHDATLPSPRLPPMRLLAALSLLPAVGIIPSPQLESFRPSAPSVLLHPSLLEKPGSLALRPLPQLLFEMPVSPLAILANPLPFFCVCPPPSFS